MLHYPIMLGATALIAFASAVYAHDQHSKREEDQRRFREEIAALEERLAGKEREFRGLLRRLGRKSRQVRELAREIERLREALAEARARRDSD